MADGKSVSRNRERQDIRPSEESHTARAGYLLFRSHSTRLLLSPPAIQEKHADSSHSMGPRRQSKARDIARRSLLREGVSNRNNPAAEAGWVYVPIVTDLLLQNVVDDDIQETTPRFFRANLSPRKPFCLARPAVAIPCHPRGPPRLLWPAKPSR